MRRLLPLVVLALVAVLTASSAAAAGAMAMPHDGAGAHQRPAVAFVPVKPGKDHAA